MKKWKTEINLWASMPDGTKVWFKDIGGNIWTLISDPTWYQNCTYVVNDNNAEIIKQFHDDASKVEYFNIIEDRWEQTSCKNVGCTRTSIGAVGHKYRIKPEDVYYYIWEKLKMDGGISISNPISDNHAESFGYTSDGWRKIESSKRTWND